MAPPLRRLLRLIGCAGVSPLRMAAFAVALLVLGAGVVRLVAVQPGANGAAASREHTPSRLAGRLQPFGRSGAGAGGRTQATTAPPRDAAATNGGGWLASLLPWMGSAPTQADGVAGGGAHAAAVAVLPTRASVRVATAPPTDAPAAVAEAHARLVSLRQELEEARRERDTELGQLAGVQVAQALFEDHEATIALTPQQMYRKMQRMLAKRTEEVLLAQAFLKQLRTAVSAKLSEESTWHPCPLRLIGSYQYGWVVSDAIVTASPPESVVFSFGVGKEISFDLDLIAAFVAEKREIVMHEFDPDPRTIEWAERQRLTKRLRLHEVGLGASSGSVDFWQLARRSGTMLSNEFSKTKEEDVRITVQAKTMAALKESVGADRLQLVKIDIDGYEYSVLDQLTPTNLNSSHLLLDMHAGTNDIIADVNRLSMQAIRQLTSQGWRVLNIDERAGRKFTFVHVCTPANTVNGIGDCMCCYPDVSYWCVLAA